MSLITLGIIGLTVGVGIALLYILIGRGLERRKVKKSGVTVDE